MPTTKPRKRAPTGRKKSTATRPSSASPARRAGALPVGQVWGPASRAAILAALRKGSTHKLAAEVVGINPRTLKTWLARGRANLDAIAAWERAGEHGERPELDAWGAFALDVARAEGDHALDLVGVVVRAAKRGEWRAALALLGRRRPLEFGESIGVRPEGVDDEGERHDTTDALLERLRKAAESTRGGDGASR